jgi:hypothetical protein
MRKFRCAECETEFLAERAEICLKCRSNDLIPLEPEISGLAASQEGSEVYEKVLYERIADVLRGLSARTYELPFKGQEWEREINTAAKEIAGLLTGAAR